MKLKMKISQLALSCRILGFWFNDFVLWDEMHWLKHKMCLGRNKQRMGQVLSIAPGQIPNNSIKISGFSLGKTKGDNSNIATVIHELQCKENQNFSWRLVPFYI